MEINSKSINNYKLVKIIMFLIFPLGSSTGFDNRYQAVSLSNVTHEGSTEISSGKERSRGISNQKYLIFRLIW